MADWTYRRVPNPIARGLAVASAAAVGLFGLHVGGWGFLDRLDTGLIGAAFIMGFPVAILVTFHIGAPILRALHRRGSLDRGRVLGVGALAYGGIALLWMLWLVPGPPEPFASQLAETPEPWRTLAAGLYLFFFTPVAFALYGALAAGAGWVAAFGRAARATA